MLLISNFQNANALRNNNHCYSKYKFNKNNFDVRIKLQEKIVSMNGTLIYFDVSNRLTKIHPSKKYADETFWITNILSSENNLASIIYYGLGKVYVQTYR